jgi:hypothetical protein
LDIWLNETPPMHHEWNKIEPGIMKRDAIDHAKRGIMDGKETRCPADEDEEDVGVESNCTVKVDVEVELPTLAVGCPETTTLNETIWLAQL